MTPEAIDVLIGCNEADLAQISRQVAELNRKWDRLQEERARLLKLRREVQDGEVDCRQGCDLAGQQDDRVGDPSPE